jgi:hypothetical protein
MNVSEKANDEINIIYRDNNPTLNLKCYFRIIIKFYKLEVELFR